MLHKSNSCCVIAALAAMLSLPGCGDDSPAALRAAAKAQEQKSEYRTAVITLKTSLQASPNDKDTRFQLAQVYLELGEGLSAEKEIRMAISQGYPPDTALPVLGRALLLLGQFQKVLDETAPALPRQGAALLCVRGDALLALSKYDAARTLYESVLRAHPAYPAALIGMGRVAYLARDVAAANQYAAQALTAAPRNTDVLLFKGDLLRAENQPAKALATYDQVLAINPAHRTAHVEKAYLEIGMGKYDAAQADLDAAREATPASVLVAYTQALLDFSQGKYTEADTSLRQVLRVAPDHMPTVLLAGALNLNLGSLYQAEHHLRHYLDVYPDNLHARKLLAQALLRGDHTPDALSVLEPALTPGQQDVQLLALAGESYLQARNFNKAGEFFELASNLSPKAANLRTSLAMSKLGKGEASAAISDLQLATKLDAKSPQAGFTLVRTELALGHVDSAYTAMLALEQAQPDNAAVQDLKGMVYVGKRDGARARAQFNKALALQPSFFPAAANLAQLDMQEQNPAAAKQHLQAFVDKNPADVEALTSLASLAAGEGKKEEATKWLLRANEVDPDAVAPAVNLIAQYLRTGQTQKALDLAQRLQVTHPENPDLLDLLGKGLLANGQQVEALVTYKQLAVALPRSATAQMQVAAMLMLLKRYDAAEESLKTALAMQPDFPAAQLALAEVYSRKGAHELALLVAARMQANHPKAAAGFQLQGDVLMGQRKAALALPAFEQALAFSKTSELVIKTANAQRLSGNPDAAAKRLAAWLQQHPDDLRVQLFIAETLGADKQYKQAAAQLDAIVKREPKNVVALNNLALAYQKAGDPRAQQAAEQAYALAKDQPVIMDTLGWILVDQGDGARAVKILREALAKAPEARDIRYHLAAALFKAGDKPAARREVDQLLAGDTQFADADLVRALLKQLQ